MRAIDADKLLKRVEQSWQNAGLHGEDCYKFKKWVHSMPTIEAEPTKHGRWIEERSGKVLDLVKYHCSECGRWQAWSNFPYCPNCGAKMTKG